MNATFAEPTPAHPGTILPVRRAQLRSAWVALIALAAVWTGCGAHGSSLQVERDTPLAGLRVGVLAHPEKLEAPETDENAWFVEFVQSLPDDRRPFESTELVRDPSQSDADVFLSLNLDINYVTQVSRAANIPKILTLYLWAVFGLPSYKSSAHYPLSAVLYDREMNILNALYIHEPVHFMWDNQYWAPEPEKLDSVRHAYHRLLNRMDREMRHSIAHPDRALGRFRATEPAVAAPALPSATTSDSLD